ncbi:MAG: GyrI-like domain-containing protein [Clostridiales bacterium]
MQLFEKLFKKLYLWANERSLIKDISNWVVIYHDQSDFTEDEKLRISVCLEVDKLVNTEGEIGFYHLDSGNYVVGVFEVDESEYQYAWNYMLFEWIPKSRKGCKYNINNNN